MGQGVQSCFIGQSEQFLRGLEGLTPNSHGGFSCSECIQEGVSSRKIHFYHNNKRDNKQEMQF